MLTVSLTQKVSLFQIDDINFQDDRLWIQYGGQYSATGVHPDCPERYRGRVYVNNEQWDVRALGDCSSGSVQRGVASSSFFQDDPTNRYLLCVQDALPGLADLHGCAV